MHVRIRRGTLVALLSTLGVLAGVQTASAAPPDRWGCDARPFGVSTAGTDVTSAVGLLTANPSRTPCADDARTLASATGALTTLNGAGIDAGVAEAATSIDPDTGPATAQTASSSARVDDFGADVPGAAGIVTATTATAAATGHCVNGLPALAGSSNVGGVRVAGVPVDLDGTARTLTPAEIGGLPAGTAVTLVPNQESSSGGTLTRTALHVTVVSAGATVLSLDVAQATVASAEVQCARVAPAVAVVASGATRTVAATVTAGPGRAIASCAFTLTPAGGAARALTGTYDPATGRCTAALAPAAFPPGSYAVTATGTDDLGSIGTGTGTQVVAGPAVGAPVVHGDEVSAPVGTPPGTTITACSFSVRASSGTTTTLPGTLADGTCRAKLSAAIAGGTATIVASATDSNGDRGTASTAVALGSAAGTRPDFRTASTAALLLGCSNARIVLVDVRQAGRRTRLTGVADRSLVGRRVELVFTATRKVVARVVVKADGSFTATAALPPKRLRTANSARYQARVGRLVSLKLKFTRRAMVTSLRRSGSRVLLAGRTTAPLARRGTTVSVRRLVACGRYRTVASVRTDARGRFSARTARPDARAAIYRVTTRVPNSPGSRRTGRTFSLPTPIRLK